MPKSDFLLIGTSTITHKEPINTTNFGEPSLLIVYNMDLGEVKKLGGTIR